MPATKMMIGWHTGLNESWIVVFCGLFFCFADSLGGKQVLYNKR
ncbi:MAG: hypothetical protein ACYC6W_10355 [Nitrosotalea sp.]